MVGNVHAMFQASLAYINTVSLSFTRLLQRQNTDVICAFIDLLAGSPGRIMNRAGLVHLTRCQPEGQLFVSGSVQQAQQKMHTTLGH